MSFEVLLKLEVGNKERNINRLISFKTIQMCYKITNKSSGIQLFGNYIDDSFVICIAASAPFD